MGDEKDRLRYFGLEEPPPFAGTILKAWSETEFRDIEPYVAEEQRLENASVNVFRVVGTRHPDYAGKKHTGWTKMACTSSWRRSGSRGGGEG
ncbi:hypothetical protein ACLG6S_16585 [Thermodesulfobacteriota bacterium B35]